MNAPNSNMNAPNSANHYQLWLAMGHIDHPSELRCKSCGLGFEEFTASKKSCFDVKEDIEIARKKLQEDEQYRQQRERGYGGYHGYHGL